MGIRYNPLEQLLRVLTMSVNPKLQANEDPSDSTESEEVWVLMVNNTFIDQLAASLGGRKRR